MDILNWNYWLYWTGILTLAQIFPIELNDKNPQEFGWRWKKGASLDIPGMTTEEALMISVTEKHLNNYLISPDAHHTIKRTDDHYLLFNFAAKDDDDFQLTISAK